MRCVLDIEANGLLNEPDERSNATKIHCICWHDIDTGESGDLIFAYDMVQFLLQPNLTLIGHKIITYDVPLLEKILGIKVNARLIDTLGLSWYLYPNRIKHGLEEWGEDLGIAKPPVTDWNNEPVEVYVHRCSQDVKINTKLFKLQIEYLKKIYNTNLQDLDRIISYLSYKLDCAKEQEEVKIKINKEKAIANLQVLQTEKDRKIQILSDIMPSDIKYKVVSRPKVTFKKDENVSVAGQKWFDLLKEQGLPDYHLGAIKVIDKVKKGNPTSHQQVKAWLFGLGWQPDVFKYVKEIPKKSEEPVVYTAMNNQTTRAVPQVSTEDGSELSDSVKDLFEIEPRLEELDSLYKINHRIGCIQAFLDKSDKNNFVKAEIAGFTNTLRFKHSKPIVNMPASPKKYWEMVRGCIIAPTDEHVLCGADMSSLEDSTKQHYMYFFDPKYVTEMRTPGFDPHLDIGVIAGLMTKEESDLHKLYEKTEGKEGKSFKTIRSKAKKTNFAAVYGAGPPKIALTAKIPLQQAKTLHSAYWIRNKSVKQVAASAIHKTVDGQMWLYNPVSHFWYSLRYEKDKFSTLNQGTGVFCFDTWVKHVRQQQVKIAMQYHDEICFPLSKETKDKYRTKLNFAITKVNEEIKLNIPLGISIQFGDNYANVH